MNREQTANRSQRFVTRREATQRAVLFAAIAMAVVIVYLPAFRGDFVWDDFLLVTSNPLLQNVSGLAEPLPPGEPQLVTGEPCERGRPHHAADSTSTSAMKSSSRLVSFAPFCCRSSASVPSATMRPAAMTPMRGAGLPGAIVALCRRAGALDDATRALLEPPPGYDGPVPLSM